MGNRDCKNEQSRVIDFIVDCCIALTALSKTDDRTHFAVRSSTLKIRNRIVATSVSRPLSQTACGCEQPRASAFCIDAVPACNCEP